MATKNKTSKLLCRTRTRLLQHLAQWPFADGVGKWWPWQWNTDRWHFQVMGWCHGTRPSDPGY